MNTIDWLRQPDPNHNIWVKVEDLSEITIHIRFNDALKNEERNWFNELLVAGLYPDFDKVKQFAAIFRDWTEAKLKAKLAVVSHLLCRKWELKLAFNSLLPQGSWHVKLTDKEKDTRERYSDELLHHQLLAQVHFYDANRTYVIQFNSQNFQQEGSELARLAEAIRMRRPYYSERLYEENADDRGRLLQQGSVTQGKYRTYLTPFQVLLGKVCESLYPHCMKTLLDFKHHLLDITALAHVVVNIGLEPMFENDVRRMYIAKLQ